MKHKSYALSIAILQIMAWIYVVLFIAMSGFFIYGYFVEDNFLKAIVIFQSPALIAGLIAAILHYYIAKGLTNYKKWARYITMVLGVFMLFGFPIGTILGVVFIYGMTKGYPINITANSLEKSILTQETDKGIV